MKIFSICCIDKESQLTLNVFNIKHQGKALGHKLLFKKSRCEGEEVEKVADQAKHLCGNSHLESRPLHFCSLQDWIVNELSSGSI